MENNNTILNQPKSDIITNPLIPNKVEEKEIVIQETRIEKSIFDQSINTFFSNISSSFFGFLNDLINKPENEVFFKHFLNTIVKDDRYFYLSFLLLVITLYVYAIRN